GLAEVRRPRHTASLNVAYRFLENAQATLTIRHTGAQFDNEFASSTPQTRAKLDAFTLVNIGASYELTGNLELFARAENLLDERYEEVLSYRAPGLAAYAGVRTRF
ncbi:MAG: TonB-dependent receptor, partial [Alphaproteobacteria bacterium]|nr:TonB-dependent receptor [Alphaproteobacteria bacterium]